jgi:preprotein translocase subunit SecG
VEVALYLALILVSITVIIAVLLQGKGSGLGGGIFAGSSIYSSRRGVEKTIFNMTVVLMIVFIILNLAAVLYGG